MTEAIRILIADDHPIVREGVRTLISTEPGMTCVGEACDGDAAVRLYRDLQPDVLLLDLMMPRKDGITAIQEIKRLDPGARVLVLTSFADDDKLFPAIKAGALGYLLKDSSPQELLRAIRQVFQGESSLHPMIARKVLQELNRPSTLPLSQEPLSEREVQVLNLIAGGLSNQEIAGKLVISEHTVRNHVRSILSKLQLANRTQAALYALRNGPLATGTAPTL